MNMEGIDKMKRVDKSARLSYELLYDLGIEKKRSLFSNTNRSLFKDI